MGRLETTDGTMARTGPSSFSIKLLNDIRYSLLNHGLLSGDEDPADVVGKAEAIMCDVINSLDYCFAMEQRLGERRRFTNHDEVRAWLKAQFDDLCEVNNESMIDHIVRHSQGFDW